MKNYSQKSVVGGVHLNRLILNSKKVGIIFHQSTGRDSHSRAATIVMMIMIGIIFKQLKFIHFVVDMRFQN